MATAEKPNHPNISSKINIGIIYSTLSFAISIAISFYIYKFLWLKIDRALFVAWFAVFEISQFLLLLDLGFTHTFIRKYIHSPDSEINSKLPELRGTLFFSGAVAAVVLVIIAANIGSFNKDTATPYFLLALSVFLTLVSYAETAALRIKTKFKELYSINIFANITFALYLYAGYPENSLDRLAVAIFLRSAIQLVAQNRILNLGSAIKFRLSSGGNFEIISLNSAYFLLFLFDAAILSYAGLSAGAIAIVIILRKYYDALRGLWDTILSVASIGFAHSHSTSREWGLRVIVLSSFCLALLISNYAIKIWLGATDIEINLNFAIAASTLTLTIFRIDGTRLFFQHRLNIFAPLALSIAIKTIYIALIFNNVVGFVALYSIQAILLLLATIVISASQRRN